MNAPQVYQGHVPPPAYIPPVSNAAVPNPGPNGQGDGGAKAGQSGKAKESELVGCDPYLATFFISAALAIAIAGLVLAVRSQRLARQGIDTAEVANGTAGQVGNPCCTHSG